MMRQGMGGFLEAQQARYRMPYVYCTSLNPTISQFHYFSEHGIPFSPLYDISPTAPAAYQFSPLAQAQQELYCGMLTSIFPLKYIDLTATMLAAHNKRVSLYSMLNSVFM